MYAVGPGGTLARNQGLCQSYVSAKILMHMTHVICCLSRMKSQWWFFFFLGGGGGEAQETGAVKTNDILNTSLK